MHTSTMWSLKNKKNDLVLSRKILKSTGAETGLQERNASKKKREKVLVHLLVRRPINPRPSRSGKSFKGGALNRVEKKASLRPGKGPTLSRVIC